MNNKKNYTYSSPFLIGGIFEYTRERTVGISSGIIKLVTPEKFNIKLSKRVN